VFFIFYFLYQHIKIIFKYLKNINLIFFIFLYQHMHCIKQSLNFLKWEFDFFSNVLFKALFHQLLHEFDLLALIFFINYLNLNWCINGFCFYCKIYIVKFYIKKILINHRFFWFFFLESYLMWQNKKHKIMKKTFKRFLKIIFN
jgi:hypothetical protein